MKPCLWVDSGTFGLHHEPMSIQVLIVGIHLARSTRGKPGAPPAPHP